MEKPPASVEKPRPAAAYQAEISRVRLAPVWYRRLPVPVYNRAGRPTVPGVPGCVEGGTVATATMTDTDRRVKNAVWNELEWDPTVDASAIGVAAEGGSVTLTGYIDTYAGKLAAERAAKAVRGVRAVANDLDVRLSIERTDADIATDAARAFALRTDHPRQRPGGRAPGPHHADRASRTGCSRSWRLKTPSAGSVASDRSPTTSRSHLTRRCTMYSAGLSRRFIATPTSTPAGLRRP